MCELEHPRKTQRLREKDQELNVQHVLILRQKDKKSEGKQFSKSSQV